MKQPPNRASVSTSPGGRPTPGGDPSRWLAGGMAGGAAIGFVAAGPAGMVGGALGGAVLGRALNWWHGLPAADPNASPPSIPEGHPAILPAAASPVVTPAPATVRAPATTQVPVRPPASTASAPAQVRAPRPAVPSPQPAIPPVATVVVPAAANLINTAASSSAVAVPLVRVPPPGKQFCRTALRDLIKLVNADANTSLEYHASPDGTCLLAAQSCPPRGRFTVYYRIVTQGTAGAMSGTTLNIQPSADQLLTAMGFKRKGWRWERQQGTALIGAKTYGCHLTVPENQISLPMNMHDELAILERLFPNGKEFEGTHMSIECRQSEKMNNAAYYLNDKEKNAQGYSKEEQKDYIKACKKKMTEWRADRLDELRTALATF